MNIIETGFEGLLLIEPKVFPDGRGYFFESYNKQTFRQFGLDTPFVQDNQSQSQRGVLRGLHFQNPPHAQTKLVRVISGKALDVCLDIRKGSKTYGQHYTVELSAENKKALWIPEGFAHGFTALTDDMVFCYKCSRNYHRDSEDGILWNDPQLAIDWKTDQPLVSEKDKKQKSFASFQSMF